MGELTLGAVMSILTGLALWLVLPRGVVLTRSVRAEDLRGRPVYDTWELRNASALTIKISSVTVLRPSAFDSRRGKIIDLELNEADDDCGVELKFDDSQLDIGRTDRGLPWKGIEVPPGDTLEAKVSNNTRLRIRYRRSGWSGVFERREITVHGYA